MSDSNFPLRHLIGRRQWFLHLCVACLVACLCRTAPAQESEYQVKAAFLYKFTNFVAWPSSAFADSGSPFVIAVLGRDPFGSSLDRVVEGKTVNGRSLVVKRFRHLDDLQPCQMLFICASENDDVSRIVEHLGRAHTLVVGDVDQFAQRGGAINFIIEDNRVRFEINPDAVDRAGLNVSSKLMALARIVHTRHE